MSWSLYFKILLQVWLALTTLGLTVTLLIHLARGEDVK